ncbi:TetR/AcrR family transcriptional regulator [Paenibacillus sabinae]|uniref:TetR family transcriptional regulator n=1 Tax=Paenibacillus sabinae T27 TaxID=1268072 RepID=X4ZKZ6_9BACL|nr:TetR/AcrR family transcriptional regulator [Paenibacillus sabinae]AHV97962.1 TetR family transcriptional regulator [Paenibacillus sabinae T27]
MSQKRQEIIESAALLIHSKGYESTKLSDILEASKTGKGQFYYYFSSKHELGLAVIDYFFSSFNRELLENILSSRKSPEVRLNEMLEWMVESHNAKESKCGCVFGNLAVEMSEHDEEFRKKVGGVFEAWTEKVKLVLMEMFKSSEPIAPLEVEKLAQGVVAMLEGGLLMMKNKQDIDVFKNMTELVRSLVKNFASSHLP